MAGLVHDLPANVDVVVVGGGGSGLAAAVSAAENGCTVLVLEKHEHLGGTTGIAVGSFTAAGTSMQRRAGIDDCSDAHAEDVSEFAPPKIEVRNNRDLRQFFIGHAADTFEWLRAMGLVFQGPNPEPPNRVPRMHNVVPGAKAFVATLQARLKKLGGQIFCGANVVALLQSNDRVGGVTVQIDGRQVTVLARKGVVLAAGDYANAADLIAEFKGAEFASVEGINPYACGDGHRLARAVGAQLNNMDITYGPELRFVAPPCSTFQQWLPSSGLLARALGWCLPLVPKAWLAPFIKRLLVTWQHPENRLFDDGAILINQEGERFCNETRATERELAVANQRQKWAYLVLDERLIERYSHWPHFISTAPMIAYAYVQDYIRLRPDVAVVTNSLEKLAAIRRVPSKQVRQTIDRFNSYVAGQASDPYGRVGDVNPLRGSRWALLGPVKSYFTTTEGGVAVNERLEVLTSKGQPIKGLYAVGQNGLGGQILWGHGLHIAWALTSGRLAGRTLAETKALEQIETGL